MIVIGKLVSDGSVVAGNVEFSVDVHPSSSTPGMLWDGVFKRPSGLKISSLKGPIGLMLQDGRVGQILINTKLIGDGDEMIRFLGHDIPPWATER